MKILYLESSFVSSGPTNQLGYLINGLNDKKFKKEILFLSKKKNKNFNNIKIHNLSLPKGVISILFLSKLKKKIDEIKPDIIHINSSFRCLLFSYILNLNNVIFVLRNDPKVVWSDNYIYLSQIILKNLYIHLLSKVNLICCSKYLFNKYQYYSKKKKSIIYNAVEKKNFCKKSKSKNKTFLILSRIIKTKNIFFLVNSFKNSKNLSFHKLIIAGKGNLQKKLISLIGKNAKNIKFLGYQKNIDKLFKITDYHLSASTTEGFPNSVLESLNRKIPAVLSNIPQHREIYQSDKILKKLLFKNNSKESLFKSIKFLINNEKKINKKINKINNKFSLSNMIHSYENFYKKILNEK